MIPEKYQWLETIGKLPKLLSSALQYLGVTEIKGAKSNPVIMDMARGLGVSDIYKNDDISWCAVFINHLIRINGKPPVDFKGDRYNLLRAKWLLNWGEPVMKGAERMGDIVVLNRDGGGHTTIWVAKTPNGFIGIGGNQNDSVKFSEFSDSRIDGVRHYYATQAPASAQQWVMDSTGKLSTNEA